MPQRSGVWWYFIGQRNLDNLYLCNFAAAKDKAESLSWVAVV
jgi:hypothetical protein